MRLEACLHLLLLLNGALGLRRGPHHPHGQSPVERRHHHYKPRGVDSLTAESEVLHDAQHLEEDNKVLTAETLAKMSPEELEFHYFSAHDFDKNSKLDGLELLKAVYHTLQHETDEPFEDHDIEPNEDEMDAYIATLNMPRKCGTLYMMFTLTKLKKYNKIIRYLQYRSGNYFNDYFTRSLVDRTLESDDTDRDGYVSYAEYRAARAKNPSDKPPIVMAINKP
ncbi:uncharacterized protein LOC115442822 isoform X1 [Manduca sexta]|uniref:uncharacterized protein LOC115442822 isoform X1 n=1 Tax=Manduca sexta TaxID=7130 RepID=UPI00188DDC6C|nr:uncharacterized protein LOC115442822 isoform X1 [Manduca sexta]